MAKGVVLWALLAVAHAGELRAQAPVQLHVELADDACPSAAQLSAALTPVLEREVELVIDAAPNSRGARRAVVRDYGTRYAIEIDGARREVEDARRDCEERARVASVFVALNMRAAAPQQASAATPDKPKASRDQEPKRDREPAAEAERDDEAEPEEPDAPDEPDEPYAPPPDRSGVGVLVYGAAAHSTKAERTAFGAGVGAYLATYSFRFELSAGVLAPIELALEPSGDIRGRVELLRVPFALTASYLLSVGDFQLGPTLGLVLDFLHLEGEGEGVDRPQSSLRMSAGGLLGVDVQLWLSDRVGLWLRPQLQAFPMAYRLAVDPNGSLGQTPQLWLSAQLGLQARFW